MIRDGQKTKIRGRRMYQLEPADTIQKISGGGAGVGDPAERDPEKVRWDVINKFVSLEKAREIYKVAINPKTLQIDLEETRILRGQRT
jgi:N-methylhydantoinase B